MANFQVLRPGGPVRGVTRYRVGAAPRMTEELIIVMRPAETGHPERWPMDPMFPAPGKRGGSRPPISQGEPAAVAAAAAAAAAELPQEQPSLEGTYPPPRTRYPIEIYDADGNPSTPPNALDECKRPDGKCFSYDFLCNAQGTTIAKVSPRISCPFIVNHIQVATDAGPGDGLYVQVLSAPDDDLSAPLTTTGKPIITDGSAGNARLKAVLPSTDLWPGYWEHQSGQHIKVTIYQLVLLTPRVITVNISLALLR